MNNLFEEHQSQRRLIPWFIISLIWFFSITHIYNNGISKENFIFEIVILLILPLTITLLLYLMKLSVIIDKYFLMYKMFPFHWTYKKVKLVNIKNALIKEYNTNKSFHGWGLSLSLWGKDKSYTVKGYKGVEVLLKNGEKIFLGTQDPESFYNNLNLK